MRIGRFWQRVWRRRVRHRLTSAAACSLSQRRRGSDCSPAQRELSVTSDAAECISAQPSTIPAGGRAKDVACFGTRSRRGMYRRGVCAGGELGDECVDGVLGPAVGDELWEAINSELRRLGWSATIDLFATASNARCARYCSRTHEAGAERTDAFTMLDWSASDCPGAVRRRTG